MREPSNMVVIPFDDKEIDDPKFFLDNLKASDLIDIVDVKMDEKRGILLDVKVEDSAYSLVIHPTMLDIPSFIRPMHRFSKEEARKLEKADMGLSICMDFEGDNAKCFFDQLRIIDAMFPSILAILDCPAEKLLSGKWVSLAAKSKIPPAPRYLFTVQAVGDDNGEVWLHTHGLKRCGMYELEVLCSKAGIYDTHYSVIETFAYRMLESDEGINPGDAVFVGQAGGRYLVCTAVNWREALDYYPEATIGTEEDREDGVHDQDTFVLMMYANPDDKENRVFTRIQEYEDALKDNPVFMLSTEETDRMKSLATERVPYLIKGFERKGNKALVKIGILADEEHWDDGVPQREHLWFELKKVDGDSFTAELTNEPYYISNLKMGDVGTYSFSDITDWILFTKDYRITPDDVYLLD